MRYLSCTYLRYSKWSFNIHSDNLAMDGGAVPRPVLDHLRVGTEVTVTARRGGDSLM
jgi:hypothetical protein